MAPRKVLGNDPFKQGAATREPVARRPPPPRPPGQAAPRAPRRAPTPELQTPAPAASVSASPAAAEVRAAPTPPASAPPGPAPARAPGAHPGPPARGTPIRHGAAPDATSLDGPEARGPRPRPHANTPDAPADPVEHAGTPTSEPLRTEPVHHPNSPGELPRRQVPALASRTPASSLPAAALGMLKAAGAVLGLGPPSREVDDWGKDAALSRSLRPLAEFLYDRYWRVQTSGVEHVPAGPCVLVANHSGALALDGPVLHLALRRDRPELPDARWLLEDQLFFAPLVGALANRLGAVRATPENAHRLLDEGRPMIVFPEGLQGLSRPFSERHRLTRFGRGGYLKVALRAGVPVVPVALVGGDEASPLLGRLPGGAFGFEYLPLTPPPLPARWYVRFGPPVSLVGAPAELDADPAWVEARNLEVRDALQALLSELVAERTGVF